MSTLNLLLPDSLEAFVHQQATEGGYSTSADYVRDVLGREKDRDQLRRLLSAGAESGPGKVADAAYFDALRQRPGG